jgi:hypothetical protein
MPDTDVNFAPSPEMLTANAPEIEVISRDSQNLNHFQSLG